MIKSEMMLLSETQATTKQGLENYHEINSTTNDVFQIQRDSVSEAGG